MNAKNDVCFVSVDVEASGPFPPTFNMLSLGACLVDDDRVTFKRLLCPISEGADPRALEVSGLSFEELRRTGTDPTEAMRDFRDWVLVQASEKSPVFVGLNAAFDWAFVNYYLLTYAGSNPFGFAPLDIKAYYAGAAGAGWMESRSSRMAQRLGAMKRSSHDALDDAVAQAELFRLTRDLSAKHR